MHATQDADPTPADSLTDSLENYLSYATGCCTGWSGRIVRAKECVATYSLVSHNLSDSACMKDAHFDTSDGPHAGQHTKPRTTLYPSYRHVRWKVVAISVLCGGTTPQNNGDPYAFEPRIIVMKSAGASPPVIGSNGA